MKLTVPKIIRPLALDEYARELEGIEVHVWVNPTRVELDANASIMERIVGLTARIDVARKKEAESDGSSPKTKKVVEQFRVELDGILAEEREWWARALSQSANKSTHWTADEIAQLQDQDQALWNFVRSRASEMIRSNREFAKKDLVTSS